MWRPGADQIGFSTGGTTTISSPTVSIPGNLVVSGTQTINNGEMISTSNGIVFEGATNDAIETTLKAVDPTVGDQVYQLPNKATAGTWTLATTEDTAPIDSPTFTTAGADFAIGDVANKNRIQSYSTGVPIRFLNTSNGFADISVNDVYIGGSNTVTSLLSAKQGTITGAATTIASSN